MLNKLFYIFLFFVIPFYFISCSHTEPETQDFGINTDSMTADKLKYILNFKAGKINTFEAEGGIEFETPESGNSGSILIAVNKPDTLYARIRGPFGITGAIMTINREDFTYYNVQESFAVKGSTTPENLSYILRFKIDFDLLVNIASGTYHFGNDSGKSDYFYKLQSEFFYVSYDSASKNTTKITIDSNFNIKNISINDSDGIKLIQVEYSDYKNLNGIYFPFNVYFNRIKEKEQLWLNYSDVKPGTGNIKYKVKLPASIKIMYWE